MSVPPPPTRGPEEHSTDSLLHHAAAGTPVPPARKGGPPRFAEDDIVAKRYRIVRFIAQGGMGEVYEAEDRELGGHVALKTVRPEIAQDARTVERFKREIQLARKVTHPNVCRIFDLGLHQSNSEAPNPGQTVMFLTMELLRGETLSSRLRRNGRMAEPEALPLVRQMAAALAAAHAAGVVHRDFKSANIVLMPQERSGGERVVVTDFGLARTRAAAERAMTVEGLVGTPAYMAPEQVEGRPVGPAADIYAFGVVLYEMLTGHLPFVGQTPLSTAIKRLREDPAAPRTHVPALDTSWETVILRCLARNPADRYSSALELLQILDRPKPALTARGRPWALVLAAVAILVVGLGIGVLVMGDRNPGGLGHGVGTPQGTGNAGPHTRRAVAVLGFKNLSGVAPAAWLSTALAEMLGTELSAGEQLRIIPGENVARMKMELQLGDQDSFAPETLTRIRRNLGTDLVVLGSYLALGPGAGGQLRLDLRLQDAAAGETIALITDMGTEDQLLEMVSRVGSRLREKLGIELQTPRGGLAASLPRSPEAARLYAEGLARLRLFDALSARELLEKAVAADPSYPPAHSALGEAWAALGYDEKARDEAQHAFEASGALPREERLYVEARYREAASEWDKAIDLYTKLSQFFPDNLEYGLRLAGAQTKAGRGREALATVEILRALPAPSSTDPRIDLAEADAASSLSDFQRQLAAAEHAANHGQSQDARLLVARARMSQWWAWRVLGQQDKATTASAEAQRIYAAAGDRGGVAQALNATATVLRDEGKLDAAEKLDQESLAVFRELGDQRRVSWALNNLGNGRRNQGDLESARQTYEETRRICTEIGDRSGQGRAMMNTGQILILQGQLEAARQLSEEALVLRREVGDKRGVVGTLFNIGNSLYEQGQLEAARTRHEEAVKLALEVGDQRLEAFHLANLGRIRLAQDQLPEARKLMQQALDIRLENEHRTVPDSRLTLASLAIEEGHPDEAERIARQVADELPVDRFLDSGESPGVVLTAALLAQGHQPEAVQALQRARSTPHLDQYLHMRLQMDVLGARIQAASGTKSDRQAATQALEQVLTQAQTAGLLSVALDARLQLGQIELVSGRRESGLARLEALEQEARGRGFLLLARKAHAAAARP